MPRILTGSLVTFALPDLLQWLEVSRHSGRLSVRKEGTKRSIDFLRGSIVFVSSNRPGERLGTFLEARGILPRGTLFEALAENFLTGRNLTRVLLDRGLVSREALAAAVEELAVRILLDMFRWPRADFEFDPEAPTEDILHIRLSLHGQLLAMHGAKLVDDATRWADADEARAASSLPAPDGLDPEEVSRTFWSLLERIQTAGLSLENARELYYGFHRFGRGMSRRLRGPLRPAPIFDDTADLLRRALEEEEAGEQLIQIAALDPFLTFDLLLIANSLAPTPHGIAGTVREAADTMGNQAFRRILDLASRPGSSFVSSPEPLERVVRTTAIATAVAASRLARPLSCSPELAYTVGLLEPIATHGLLQELVTAGVPPGPLRAAMLADMRPIYGKWLAAQAGLPEELAAAMSASGEVSSGSSLAERLLFLAHPLAVSGLSGSLGTQLSSDDVGLAGLAASLEANAGLHEEIARRTAELCDIIGL